MAKQSRSSRREFLVAGPAAGAGLWVAGLGQAAAAEAGEEEEISPAEDLMREHGVLNRILLIYEEAARRLHARQELDPATLTRSAGIVRVFVEDYHEKLEEDHLFPHFEKANKLVDLVKVLRWQHQAGRRLTDRITKLATPAGLRDAKASEELCATIGQFIRMYRPHEAREDTVLFPALRELLPEKQYEELGEQFEEREHELFGEHGFADVVSRVAHIEKALGIYNLAQFTPKV